MELSAQDILMDKDRDSHIQRNAQIYSDTHEMAVQILNLKTSFLKY